LFIPLYETARYGQVLGDHVRPDMTNRAGPTILMVDDDPLIRELGRELLENLGYRVETAANGAEALKKYRQMGGADLVVLDYVMPGLNGGQVLREFRTLDKRARVLVASGFVSSREAARLKEQGALGLIQKPYRLTELANRIRAMLAARPKV
jgi:two-component system cell cycle sensor histidine kinase/response regulator CckA